MIRFKVTLVTKRSSSEIDTTHYTYTNDERKGVRSKGAEWEEIEFTSEAEDQPTIAVANITGSFALFGNPKLVLNDPKLFGTYKIGDIIDFTSTKPPIGQSVKE